MATNADIFRNVFREHDWPDHWIDAAIANFLWESGGNQSGDINLTALGDNGASFGAAQWQGPRRRALEAYAADQGWDIADANTQARFVIEELMGPESRAYEALQRTSTAPEALDVFTNIFERAGEPHMEGRIGVLNDITGGNFNWNPANTADNVMTGIASALNPAAEAAGAATPAQGSGLGALISVAAQMLANRQPPAPPPPPPVIEREYEPISMADISLTPDWYRR